MKKLIAIFAVALATTVAANAQIGIFGGFTSSKTDLKEATSSSISLYHAGVAYKFEIGQVFCIQPGLAYQVKGARLNNIDSTQGSDWQYRTGYVELSLGLQLGIDLAVVRPFGLFEPFLGYQVTGQEQWDNNNGWGNITQVTNKFEYGFGVGGGVELFDHVQLSVQWFKNLGQLFTESSSTAPTQDVKNYQGIKFTLGLFF